MEGGRTERMQMGKWFNKEERAEELSPSDRAGPQGALLRGRARPGARGAREPREREVGEEPRQVLCFGSAFRSTAAVWLRHSKT